MGLRIHKTFLQQKHIWITYICILKNEIRFPMSLIALKWTITVTSSSQKNPQFETNNLLLANSKLS